jgi:uncharacterized protein DUF6084
VTELDFAVLDISPERFAVAPNLLVRLQLTETSGAVVHAVALRCMVRIEPQRRPYASSESDGLLDLFGERERWAQTLKPFTWTQCNVMVPGFTGTAEVDLPLPCTYDFEVIAAKYLHALRDGEVPLELLFSGTVFTRGTTGFSVEQIPWHKEVSYRMPVAVWRACMDAFFPNSGWIRLQRDSLDALAHFKSSRGLPTWEDAVDALVAGAGEVAR